MIVGAASAEDVVAAVRYAAANGLPIGVQATGHGIVNTFEGGVLVTTSRLSEVSCDPRSGRARVGAGVRWGEVIRAAAEHGLAPLSGSSPTVGVVGYTLGGGFGLLGRKYGYAADHVHRIEVVTADGELRTASADENSDLFWALRGGKGNFGIVTAIEFTLFPLPEFYGGALTYPGARAAELLPAYRDWAASVPEEMTSSIAIMRLPPIPDIPEPLRGQFITWIRISYAGDAEKGAALVEPLRRLSPAILDTVHAMPYTESWSIHMDPVDPLPAHDGALALSELSDGAIDAFLERVGPGAECSLLMAELRQMGGALAR
ncbi:MAG: FAD-binding protein, partial [Dehalococcoidia bacterium]|nr:FAD-binding protein [Dehalococcoidia bacterium]